MLVWDFQLLNTKNLRLGADARGAIGTIIQEVTPEGDVVMEWRSWDHLPLAFWETNMLIVNEMWDLFHSNSLGEAENGSILLSMRRMNQVAKIHRDTGEVLWRLGGKGGDFRIINDNRGQFVGQHDVREIEESQITMFDNSVRNDKSSGSARGLQYQLSFDSDGCPTKARLVNAYDTGIRSFAMGSYRRMANGNGVYCLGLRKNKNGTVGIPFYMEVTIDGEELIRMEWTTPHTFTYRTVKAPWIGTPTWPPKALLDDNNPAKALRLHFSWNGATEVKKWRIVTGESERSPPTEVLVDVEKTQFEHWVEVPDGAEKCQYFQAIALGAEGKEMSRSPVVQTKPCKERTVRDT
mmetsp:Transcript_13476/g.38868  ORF Transcript_13476/g.38868 Transcript_13476/m.38868 type:complete len:351 (+) Transcript_13476:231-1283(+)